MSTAPSRLDVTRTGDRIVVIGEIDAHTCPRLSEQLDAVDEGAEVRLDLAGVEFIDSSGLRVLISAHTDLAAADRRLVIENPSAAVNRIVEITGLSDHLNIVDAT